MQVLRKRVDSMGLNYSFILLCERSRVDAVLTALAEHLAPDDRTRVLHAI